MPIARDEGARRYTNNLLLVVTAATTADSSSYYPGTVSAPPPARAQRSAPAACRILTYDCARTSSYYKIPRNFLLLDAPPPPIVDDCRQLMTYILAATTCFRILSDMVLSLGGVEVDRGVMHACRKHATRASVAASPPPLLRARKHGLFYGLVHVRTPAPPAVLLLFVVIVVVVILFIVVRKLFVDFHLLSCNKSKGFI